MFKIRLVLQWLSQFGKRRPSLRNVAVLAGGTALGQAIAVVISPLLTRLYTPEDFGLLSLFISLFSIGLIINSFRYELAIVLPEDDVSAVNVLGLVLALVVMTTILFGILFIFAGDLLVQWVNAPSLKPYLGLLLVCLLGAGFYQGVTYWAIRKKAFESIARTKLEQGLGQAASQLLLGFGGTGALGLLIGYTIGQIAGGLRLARQIWRRDRAVFNHIGLRVMLSVAYRYRSFPLVANWSNLLNVIGIQMPIILFSAIYGLQVSGWFGLGQRVIGIPMTLVGTAIGHVYFSTASRLAQTNPSGLNHFFNKTALRLFFVGIVPIVLLGLFGPTLFEWVLGADWYTAGVYTQIMTPMFLAQFIVSSLSQNIYVLEWQGVQLAWDVGRFVILVCIFGSAWIWRWTPEFTIALYSGGMFVTYLLLFWLNKRAIWGRMQGNSDAG